MPTRDKIARAAFANRQQIVDFYNSGYFKDHHFPHVYARGDYREALGTLWYHDHRFDFTSQNVYRGLAGFLFDVRRARFGR